MPVPLILLQAQPRRAADGVAETVRLAGMGGALPYYYDGQHWRGGITRLPTFICALDFEGDNFGTGAVPQAAQIEWAAQSKADLAAMAAYVWDDAPVTVRIGPEGALPPVSLEGTVMSGRVEAGKLLLYLSDPSQSIKVPLLVDRYLGTGGLEGPTEWEDKIKRRLFGRVWNVEGELIDQANNIYAFADPTKPLQAIDALRDMGATAASVTTVAWAGTAAATLTALQAAVAPTGGGAAAPSIACVKWWTQPAGSLCADIRGEIGAGYIETTAAIVERLVGSVTGPAFASGTVAAAITARPAPVGIMVDSEGATVAQIIDKLLGDVSLLWAINSSNEIVLRAWEWGASAASAISHGVKRVDTFKPLGTRRLGYQHNETVMSRGDIAAIVFADYVGDPTVANPLPAADVVDTIKPGGGVADDKVTTPAIVDNAVSESNFSILELFGASVGSDDDNTWLDFAYGGVTLDCEFNNPVGGGDATAAFDVTMSGVRTGGDNDRISVRILRDDDVACMPAEWSNILFESGGQQTFSVPFFDPDPPVGASTYRVQTKNLTGHPAWQRGVIRPLRLSK